MRNFELSKKLQRILKKLFKKDKTRCNIILKKIKEICLSEDIRHYKNLSNEMSGFKRVHIDAHFVLTFRYVNKTDSIKFEDFQHHDTIYKK